VQRKTGAALHGTVGAYRRGHDRGLAEGARWWDGVVEEIGRGVRGMHARMLVLFSVHGCYFLRCVQACPGARRSDAKRTTNQ
jgi:hypothetical protein